MDNKTLLISRTLTDTLYGVLPRYEIKTIYIDMTEGDDVEHVELVERQPNGLLERPDFAKKTYVRLSNLLNVIKVKLPGQLFWWWPDQRSEFLKAKIEHIEKVKLAKLNAGL